MRPEVPLKVLGLLSPILSWTEFFEAQGLPLGWRGDEKERADLWEERVGVSLQERSWLLHELPTYSLDNVDEVIAFGRREPVARLAKSRNTTTVACLAPPAGYDLVRVFDTLSERYLTWTGGKVAVQANRMVELHELGLRLPLGAMVRHMHSRAVAAGEQSIQDVMELPESSSLLPSNAQGLRSVVRRGLSEGHLHLNSIHATEVGWADHLLKPIARRPRDFRQDDWRLFNLARASARILALAARFGLASKDPKEAGELLDVFDRMYFASRAYKMTAAAERLETVFRKILEEEESYGVLMGKPLFETSVFRGRRTTQGPGRGRLLRWIDPQFFFRRGLGEEVRGGSSTAESLKDREHHLAMLHLTAHVALVRTHPGCRRTGAQRRGQRMQEPLPGPAHRFLHGAFFRYLVCRTHHWKRGVQQARTTGLRHFKHYFDSNQRWPIEPTDHATAKAVFARARQWRGLRVLEGRISPPERGTQDLFPWLEAYADGAGHGRVEKLGLVIHFIKDHEPEGSRDPLFHESSSRFRRQRLKFRREAFRLFRLLSSPSLVNPFIVGIDAANLELSTPPEVFAPVFRFLRERPFELRDPETPDIDTWRRLDDIRRLMERRRLGMTYHVGEEFRHLLSGLRAIDEVLEFLKPQSGDRVGHAIALGLEPQVWAEQTGFQALVSKQEWLDTLVWIHHLLGPGDDLLGELQIEDGIQRLGRELYQGQGQDALDRRRSSSSITPLMLYDAWRLRQLDPDCVKLRPGEEECLSFEPLDGIDASAWRYNRIESQALRHLQKQAGRNPPVELLARYWFDHETRETGNELFLIDMEPEAELWLEVCRKAQSRLQKRVAARQIVVEVNPSANRMIGPMGRIAEHHIFDLTLDKKGRPKRRILVTVNTDNPGTANTSLAHEFYLLGESLLQKGLPEAEVVEWLEWLRQNGQDYSFVRQLPAPEHPSMERVIKDLKDRRRPIHTLKDSKVLMRELWEWIVDDESSEHRR